MKAKKKKAVPAKRVVPPKRTGKAGIGPLLDDEPNVKPNSAAAHNLSEQGELIEAPEPQPAVVKGRFMANFLKPIFSKAPKSGDRLISLHMVVMLTKDHEDGEVIPREIKAGWHFVAKNGRKRLDLDVPAQHVRFCLSSDEDGDELLALPAAKVTNCSIAIVQKKGEGEAVKQVRLSWRYQVPWSKQVEQFAASNYGATYWLMTHNTEEKLWDEAEVEEDF